MSIAFVDLFLSGLAFGILREWSGTLLAPLAAHGSANFMAYALRISFRMT